VSVVEAVPCPSETVTVDDSEMVRVLDGRVLDSETVTDGRVRESTGVLVELAVPRDVVTLSLGDRILEDVTESSAELDDDGVGCDTEGDVDAVSEPPDTVPSIVRDDVNDREAGPTVLDNDAVGAE
jgi:hypothetical protein